MSLLRALENRDLPLIGFELEREFRRLNILLLLLDYLPPPASDIASAAHRMSFPCLILGSPSPISHCSGPIVYADVIILNLLTALRSLSLLKRALAMLACRHLLLILLTRARDLTFIKLRKRMVFRSLRCSSRTALKRTGVVAWIPYREWET